MKKVLTHPSFILFSIFLIGFSLGVSEILYKNTLWTELDYPLYFLIGLFSAYCSKNLEWKKGLQ